jgi:hypothetical protein
MLPKNISKSRNKDLSQFHFEFFDLFWVFRLISRYSNNDGDMFLVEMAKNNRFFREKITLSQIL